MRRREFITLLGGAAAAWPVVAGAQQAAMPVVGFLDPTSADAEADRLRAFRQGLKEAGFVECENVEIVYRFAENQSDRLSAMVARSRTWSRWAWLTRHASSAHCVLRSMPLVSEPASIATRSSTTNALVRWRGVSPPWQPMTRSSMLSSLAS